MREATKPLLEAHHKGSIDLIVDGGSENNNATVDGFISEGGISIHKLVALRDVHFSNSIVEAVNKVVKYRYLFPKNLPDGDALQTAALAAMVDYNDFRPHGSLNGLTPTEAYQGIEKETLLAHDKLKTAQRARIEHNGRNRCQKRSCQT